MARFYFLVLAGVLTAVTGASAHTHHDHMKLECDVKKAVKEGKYDEVHGYFIEGAPEVECKQGEKYEAEYFTFDKDVKDVAEMKKKMKEEGCQPGNHHHLTTLGIKHAKTADSEDPQPRMANPIVALGSTWVHEGGQETAPVLEGDRGKDGHERRLNLHPTYETAFQSDKTTQWVFLAICDKKKSKK